MVLIFPNLIAKHLFFWVLSSSLSELCGLWPGSVSGSTLFGVYAGIVFSKQEWTQDQLTAALSCGLRAQISLGDKIKMEAESAPLAELCSATH